MLARFLFVVLLIGAASASATSNFPASREELYRSFANPPDESRIMMRWWWFGPAVTNSEIERELRAMKAGGIGGVEVQPVYPMSLDDPDKGIKNLPFLSDEFLDALRFASAKARELGLRLDLTLGSGWPYGGPNIPVSQASGKLRFERSTNGGPQLREGEILIASFPQKESNEVLHIIASRTRMMVKRAAVGAEGYVLDHYDRAALENHLTHVGERLMKAFGSNLPYAIFCDSLEVFGSDWTGGFLEEFRRRRGYDLKPYLPALGSDMGDLTGAIRHDWGLTLTELAEEQFLIPLRDWAHRRNTLLRVQTYGVPPVALGSQALVDLPEGEGSYWRQFTTSRWASSANHLLGRPVTSSETWTWLHSPAFAAAPLDIKAEADRHFLQGINQLIGHGWPYSPESAGKPGWAFYAAAVFNDSNPWWPVMPDVASYLQRLSHMLRQGDPVSDVALYLPTSDARANFTLGQVSINRSIDGLIGSRIIPKIVEYGYSFDGIDDTMLDRFCTVQEGALNTKGVRYPIVLLPGVDRIPVASYRKLESFARKGGILIATRRLPARSPGFVDAEALTREIRETSRRLFEGAGALGHFVAAEETELGPLMAKLRSADVALEPRDSAVGFVHRRTQLAEIYFLANTANRPYRGHGIFRVEGMTPEWWDPITGKVRPAFVLARTKDGSSITIDLPPYGSAMLVFLRKPQPEAARKAVPEHLPEALSLNSGWAVRFDDLERPVLMSSLKSWTEMPETQHFSGQATYEKTFSISAAQLRAGLAWILDFGEAMPVAEAEQKQPGMRAWLNGPVREAGIVYVNERRAGSVWCPPYEVDVTALLHAGQNAVRVVVFNSAINKLAGSPPPDYSALNRRFGVRFVPQDMDNLKPLPSGLLGSVRLVPRAADAAIVATARNTGKPPYAHLADLIISASGKGDLGPSLQRNDLMVRRAKLNRTGGISRPLDGIGRDN